MSNRILVVEDEIDIQNILRAFLEDSGYYIETANDGMIGIKKFLSGQFDLILLDIMLPKIDGYAVCEIIRKESAVPIIMLTAMDGNEDEIKGFELKIDDYITKPFSISLVLKRIEAVLRRSAIINSENKKLNYKSLILDLEGHQASVNGCDIILTSREFEIVRLLLKNRGRVITRQTLLSSVWEYDFYGDERIVNTHIKNIRRKIGLDYIETVRGVGYKIG